MMTYAEQPAEVLERLEALSPVERASFLLAQSGDDVESLLVRLGDETEQLVVVEVTRALRTSELVVALSDEVGGAVARSRARRARGQALAYAGRFEEALRTCEDAARIADEAGEIVQASRARIASMHALGELGRYTDATRAGNRAYDALSAIGEASLAARADINLGVIHRKCDQPERAIEHFARASGALQDEPMILAQLESNRGEALLEIDRLEEAEQAFNDALRAFERVGNKWGSAIVEGNLADLAARRGRLDRALYHFESARRHVERDQSPTHFARLLVEQGDAKRSLGMLGDAESDYREAIAILSGHDQVAELARAHAGLGQILARRGEWMDATESLEHAAETFRLLGHATAVARVDLLQSELAHARGDAVAASSCASRSRDSFDAGSIDRAMAAFHLGELAHERGDAESAARYVGETIETAERLGIVPLLADALLLRGRSRQAESPGGMAEAIADFRASVGHLERVRSTLQAEQFRASFLGNRLSAYEQLTSTLLDRADDDAIDEAFRTMEQARARSLLDAIGGAVTLDVSVDDGEDADDVAIELRDARERLNVLYSRLGEGAHGLRTEVDSGWKEEASGLERAIRSMETRLAARRGMTSMLAEPTSLGDVQGVLSPGVRLIEYFEESGQLSALVLSEDEVRIQRRFAGLADVAECVRRMRFQTGRALRPGGLEGSRRDRVLVDAQHALGSLYDLIIRPIANDLADARRLIVVGTSVLHAVPFSALWDGSSYLIEASEIVHAPSASVFHRLERERSTKCASTDALIVGVADDHAPQIDQEARSIASSLGGSTLLLNDDATVARVSEEMEGFGLVHLACHGRFDGANPLSSGLRMADRWMTVRDVYRLHLNRSFLTLSGCETGVSEVGKGNELIGLVRAFLASGASGLAVSLWKVNDALTTSFMLDFYHRAYTERDGRQEGVASAMRSAQLKMLRAGEHPALWAPFILVGTP